MPYRLVDNRRVVVTDNYGNISYNIDVPSNMYLPKIPKIGVDMEDEDVIPLHDIHAQRLNQIYIKLNITRLGVT